MKLRVEFCPGNSSVCSHALVPMHKLYPVGSCSTSPATYSSGRSPHAQHAKVSELREGDGRNCCVIPPVHCPPSLPQGLRRKFPAASSQSVAHTSGPASGSKAVEQSYSGLTNSSEEGLEVCVFHTVCRCLRICMTNYNRPCHNALTCEFCWFHMSCLMSKTLEQHD
jgi:hypothetical protein